MANDRIRYIYHIDSVRIKKKITVDEICNGICSDRQYRKYLTGANNISDKKIMEFCNNLSISARDFYYSLNEKDMYEYKQIRGLYYKLINKKYFEVTETLKNLSKITNLNKQNARFYEYCKIRFLYENRHLDKDAVHKKYSKIVNYPNCIKNNAFDFVDIITILCIAQIEIELQIEDAMKLLIRILNDRNVLYLSAENKNILPPIFSSVSIMLGKLEKYLECIRVADEGVKYCIKYSLNKSLSRLYYSRAISYKKLDFINKAEFNAALCFSNVLSRNNTKETIYFFKLLSKDFKQDPFRLINKNKDSFIQISSNEKGPNS